MPQSWKVADVVPIYKKGDSTDAVNYRPISLISAIGRVLEKLVHNHVSAFLHQNNLLSCAQHGFVSKRSTCTQLLACYNDWTRAVDESCITDVVHIDLAKALDTVPHKKLLRKLDAYGIQGRLLDWISNYLSGRVQKIKLGNITSSLQNAMQGVPQGSVLGPLSFSLYINDMPDAIKHSKLMLFADDAKLFKRIRSDRDMVALQNDISAIENWANT